MSFDEVRFPTDISAGVTSSIKREVSVVTLKSGHEHRNSPWANSRRSYDASMGVSNADDVEAVISFWEARGGALRGFRWKDWQDFKSVAAGRDVSDTDQAMALITSNTYQLQKTYSSGSQSWSRNITKPVSGTVVVRDDTGALSEGTDYTIDYTTGIVTFTVAPTGTPTAGFEFDVPVRFGTDDLQIIVPMYDRGSLPAIPIVEIRI